MRSFGMSSLSAANIDPFFFWKKLLTPLVYVKKKEKQFIVSGTVSSAFSYKNCCIEFDFHAH